MTVLIREYKYHSSLTIGNYFMNIDVNSGLIIHLVGGFNLSEKIVKWDYCSQYMEN